MKNNFFLLLFINGIVTVSIAQSVAINTTGAAAEASAILDINSTTKGFLPPRMTEAQRATISSPAQGLIIYCINCGTNGELQIFNGMVWTNMSGNTAAEAPIILPSVTIGNQIWLSTNLDVTTYQDGTIIPQVTDPTVWANSSTGAWCYYNNDATNGATYGKLYNWFAVAGIHDLDPNTPNKILAPQGWHVPTENDCTELLNYLGGTSIAGGHMKETGTEHWLAPNQDATNSSGFTALPGGFRDTVIGAVPPYPPFMSYFDNIGESGIFWSSNSFNTQTAITFDTYNLDGLTYVDNLGKVYGLSVRCVKN